MNNVSLQVPQGNIYGFLGPNGADAEKDFSQGLAVISIPRFILIDPRGNIINSELPPPSDSEFEAILQKEIRSLRSSNSF